MDLKSPRSQLTTLLDNEALGRLECMRLNPRRRRTNRTQGEHLAGKGGTSIEFSDYRNYVEGDDIRYVDWNIFSRLQRAYVKQFHYEEEMHVVLLVDASSSMQFEDKLLRAKQIAAALGMLGLLNVERVSVYAFADNSRGLKILPPCTGRGSLMRLFAFLERLEGGGHFPVDAAAEAALRRHRGRGMALVLSDFLTFGDLSKAFNLLFTAGLDVFGMQILSPTERDPDLTGDMRFVDSETAHTLDVSSVGDLLGLYHEHRLALESELETLCRQRSGQFVAIGSRDPVDWVLFDLLRRKGWVR